VPLDSDRDRKVSINMHIPSKLAGKDSVPKNVPPMKKQQISKPGKGQAPKYDPKTVKTTTTPEAPKAKGLKTLDPPHQHAQLAQSPGSDIMLDENVDPTGPGEMCAPLNSINFSDNQLAASRS